MQNLLFGAVVCALALALPFVIVTFGYLAWLAASTDPDMDEHDPDHPGELPPVVYPLPEPEPTPHLRTRPATESLTLRPSRHRASAPTLLPSGHSRELSLAGGIELEIN